MLIILQIVIVIVVLIVVVVIVVKGLDSKNPHHYYCSVNFSAQNRSLSMMDLAKYDTIDSVNQHKSYQPLKVSRQDIDQNTCLLIYLYIYIYNSKYNIYIYIKYSTILTHLQLLIKTNQ